MGTVTVTAEVCDKDHGGPHNEATFYGHYASSGVCVRVGDLWVTNQGMAQVTEEGCVVVNVDDLRLMLGTVEYTAGAEQPAAAAIDRIMAALDAVEVGE